LGINLKTVQFQGKLFTAKFLQAAVAGPILGIDFLRKFRITVAPETSLVLFAWMATATAKTPLPNISSILESPVSVLLATQKIPESVPENVKRLLQKFPSILCTGDVMPTPTHGVEHHIHTSSHPTVLQHPVAWIRKNLRLQKQNSNVWKPQASFAVQNHHGPLLCTWCLKKMDPGDLVEIIAA
jgi:hypothetical protein